MRSPGSSSKAPSSIRSIARLAMPGSPRSPSACRSMSPITRRSRSFCKENDDRPRGDRPRGAAGRRPHRRSRERKASRCSARRRQRRRLEGSKGFTKDLCARAGIPTAAYARFADAASAKAYLATQTLPIVIKADGLAAGKGVTIAETKAEAEAAIDACFAGAFGAAGAEAGDRGIPARRGSELLRSGRRHDRAAARHGAGPQARLRRRPGPEHRRHGRLFAGADHDAGALPPRHGGDHRADGARDG